VATPDAAAPLPPSRAPLNAVLAATFFVRFAFGITVAVFASYILLRSTGLGGSDVGTVGLVSATASIGEFSTVLLSGAAADRYGRFPVLFVGMIGAAILFVGVSLTRDPWDLAALNLLFGIASGAILASSLAVVADRSRLDARGYEMGRFDAMNLFGWVGGFAVGFAALGLLPNDRLNVLFWLGASALAVGTLVAFLVVRGSQIYHGAPSLQLREVVAAAFRRRVLVVTLPWLVIYMLLGTALVFLGTSSESLGVSPVLLGATIGGAGALLVLTQPAFGLLADRWGRTRMMTIGAAGFVGLMGFASLVIAYGPEYPLLAGIGVSALAALAYGPAALAALADLSLQYSRATTMAIYSLTISLGMIGGLLVSTQLYARWGDYGIYAFFALVSVSLIGLTVARYRETGIQDQPVVTTPVR
jgi:MFS transporter, DHA1 family, multidrug resistance protein